MSRIAEPLPLLAGRVNTVLKFNKRAAVRTSALEAQALGQTTANLTCAGAVRRRRADAWSEDPFLVGPAYAVLHFYQRTDSTSFRYR